MKIQRKLKAITSFVLIVALFISSFPLSFAQHSGIVQPGLQLSVPTVLGLSVNTFNGNLYSAYPLLTLPARGFPINLQLAYNSLQSGIDNGFGYGWQFNYNLYYILHGDAVAIYAEDGRLDYFIWNGQALEGPAEHQLEQYSVNRYRWTRPDGSVVFFDSPSHQHATSIRDINGNTLQFEYGLEGHLSKLIDPTGRELLFEFEDGRLSTVIDPNITPNRMVRLAYDTTGDLIQITDEYRAEHSFAYDHHLMTAMTDPRGATANISYLASRVEEIRSPLTQTRFQYDLDSLTTSVTDFVSDRQHTKQFQYNGQGNIQSVTDAKGGIVSFIWDEDGQLIGRIDEAGNQTNYAYDAQQNQVTITDALGNSTVYTYQSPLARLSAVQNPAHETTEFSYDETGNLIELTDPLGNQTSFEYNEYGELLRLTNAEGGETSFDYDQWGYLESVTDPLGNVSALQYDQIGRLITATDPIGGTTTLAYSDNGRLASVTDPTGGRYAFTYDAGGNLTQVIDPLGNAVSYTYDLFGRLIQVLDALNNETNYAYDSANNVTSITDANGNVTLYEYDELNRLARETDPLGQSVRFVYDQRGNLSRRTLSDGATTQYEYDAVNHLVETRYPDGTVQTYTYDARGQQTATTDVVGTTLRTYDASGRISTETDPAGNTVEYSYTPLGDLTQLVYPDQSVATYSYDVAGQLIRIDAPSGTTSYTYDAAGNLIKRALPNGVVSEYLYDVASRLTEIDHQDATGTSLLAFKYQLDANSRRVSAERVSVNGEQESAKYTYDALGQLTRVDYSPVEYEIFTYDAVGNRLARETSAGTVAYTYNAADYLTEVIDEAGVSTTFQYDARGNLLTRTGSSSQVDYAYNYDNQLISVSDGEDIVEYIYVEGHRFERSVNGIPTHYTYDASGLIPQLIMEQTGEITKSYSVSDTHYAELLSDSAVFYLEDGLGSLVGLSDESGSLIATMHYDAFGVPQSDNADTLLGFTGEPYDAATDLLHLGARDYDPSLGRFINPDPAPAPLALPLDLHNYVYVTNSPVNFVDPTGLSKWDGTHKDKITLSVVNVALASAGVAGATLAMGAAATVSVPVLALAGAGFLITSLNAAVVTRGEGQNIVRMLQNQEPVEIPTGIIQDRYGVNSYTEFADVNLSLAAGGLSNIANKSPTLLTHLGNAFKNFKSGQKLGEILQDIHEVLYERPSAGDILAKPGDTTDPSQLFQRLMTVRSVRGSAGTAPAVITIKNFQPGIGYGTSEIYVADPDGDQQALLLQYITASSGFRWLGSSEQVISIAGAASGTVSIICWCEEGPGQCDSPTGTVTFSVTPIDNENNRGIPMQFGTSCTIP